MRSIASLARSWEMSGAVSSSNAITMSEPSARWTSMDFSGERKCREPSMKLLNSMPSSVTFLSEESEKTWNPPLSVSMAPSQFMNL